MLLRKGNWMAGVVSQENHVEEKLAYSRYAAKAFRLIFKNAFDKLLFIRDSYIRRME